VTTSDGFLKLFDFHKATMILSFRSFFAGFTSLCWSFDGRFIATGGQDDAVNVWDIENRRLVFRGEGHNSWVSSVAFDNVASMQRPDFYRFYSGGHDGRLVIWEMSPEAIAPITNRRSTPMDHITEGPIPYPARGEIPYLDNVLEVKISSDPIHCVVVEDTNIFVGDSGGLIFQYIVKDDELPTPSTPEQDAEVDPEEEAVPEERKTGETKQSV
jgi:WD40 repeat protein